MTEEDLWSQIDHKLVALKLGAAWDLHGKNHSDGIVNLRRAYENSNPNARYTPGPLLRQVSHYWVQQFRTWLDTEYGIFEEIRRLQGREKSPEFLRAVAERVPLLRTDDRSRAKILKRTLVGFAPPLIDRYLVQLHHEEEIVLRAWRRDREIEARQLGIRVVATPASDPHSDRHSIVQLEADQLRPPETTPHAGKHLTKRSQVIRLGAPQRRRTKTRRKLTDKDRVIVEAHLLSLKGPAYGEYLDSKNTPPKRSWDTWPRSYRKATLAEKWKKPVQDEKSKTVRFVKDKYPQEYRRIRRAITRQLASASKNSFR